MTFRTLVVRSCLALTAAALLGGTAIAGGLLEAERAVISPELSRQEVRGGEMPSIDMGDGVRADAGNIDRGGVRRESTPSDDRVAMDVDLSRPGTPTIAVEGGGDAASAKDARRKGAQFLASVQKADGGWGAGTWGQADDSAPSDVATSAMVVLALHRDGDGTELHRAAIEKGVRYVLAAIESAPRDSARVTTPEGTQPQRKLGTLVDTHMAALMLTEMGGHLGKELDVAMDRGLGQVIAKVQLAQRADGSFDGEGWAPVLSNSIAATSLMRAADQGVAVDETVLKKSGDYQAARVSAGGGVDTSTGAGVDLTSRGSRTPMGPGSATTASPAGPSRRRRP